MKMPIYFDYNATTPLDPRVLSKMEPFLKEEFGNPASKSHAYGWQASQALESARQQVGALVGAPAKDVYFTSGATESNNLAILGLARKWRDLRPHFITSNVEHKAVLLVVQAAAEYGAEISILPADSEGKVSVDQVQQALRPNTKLISLMAANNEVGTINPIGQIGRLSRERNIVFHCDAAQGYGKFPIHVGEMNIDLLSISGHKIYGPKGIGALIVNHEREICIPLPISFGGAQENSLRPGTVNMSGAIGLGEAARIAQSEMASECERLKGWRDQLFNEVRRGIPNVKINGSLKERLCNNLSFSFPDLPADIFALGLSGLALSSGSACNSGDPHPSHVLKAMGLPETLARSTIRIGLGRNTTQSDIEILLKKILALKSPGSGLRAEGSGHH